LAAILIGIPTRCAISIAWSMPFSGEMRPRHAAGVRPKAIEVGGKPVINGRLPVHPRQRFTLRIGDRNNRDFRELAVQRNEVGDIEPSVQRGDMGVAGAARQRKMQVVDVEVQHVEIVRLLHNPFEHQDVMRELVDAMRVEPQRARARRDEPRRRFGVAAREERDIVTLRHQFLREVGNDSLGAAVILRGDALVKGCYLRNSHGRYRQSCFSLSF
jgi:hypothetical protein